MPETAHRNDLPVGRRGLPRLLTHATPGTPDDGQAAGAQDTARPQAVTPPASPAPDQPFHPNRAALATMS